jgi:hypothetical protein
VDRSVTAMREAIMRLSVYRTVDRTQAVAVAQEAVLWVTIIDARLIRHDLAAYDKVLAGHDLAERALLEGTLAGLRFVRNGMRAGPGDAEVIEPWAGGPASSVLAVWQWRPLPEPALRSASLRARDRQMSRYQAYEVYVARRSVGEVFGRAAAFLTTVARVRPRTPFPPCLFRLAGPVRSGL